MQGDAADHRQHEAEREHRRCAMRGGEAADRHYGGEMIEPDNRMAEPGQQPIGEGRRHAAAHEMMGEGRLGHQQ